MNELKGTGVALVTPFNTDGSVDFVSLEKLVNHCINGGLEYLVALGTTGESATLNKAEKKQVVDCIIKTANGRVPVVIGIGGNNTADVIETIKNTDFTGITAILSVSPYYNKPTQEGIYQHYKAIAEVVPKPIILYNVPGRTSSNILPATTLRLANDFKNIVAVKEASGNMEQIMDIIQHKPDGFLVISGDDALTLPIVAAGGDGVISVVANAFPKQFSDMVRLTLKGDVAAARPLHYLLTEIIKLLFAEGNPGGVKAALKQLGVMDDNVRLPLVKVSQNTYSQLEERVKKIS